jgi:CheY-like chemotaxis protein
MTFHVLVVDDNPDIVEDVRDRLESLGHTCDCVHCMACARERLASGSYSYVLLDLEIPVKYGRKSRVANGQNLLQEIRTTQGFESIPIIVMTSHGHDSPDLAIEVLRGNGATDFVKKSGSGSGASGGAGASGGCLEQAIKNALASTGRSRPGASRLSAAIVPQKPHPFESGMMRYYDDRIELCDVKICGGPESGRIRLILEELRKKTAKGAYVSRGSSELARRIGCERGQNGVVEAISNYRRKVCKLMLAEANIQMDWKTDFIVNVHPLGYRLSPKIMVCDHPEPQVPPMLLHDPKPFELEVPERSQWIMEQIVAGKHLRKSDVIRQYGVSASTAERDLRQLRELGKICFQGTSSQGYYGMGGSEAKGGINHG